jgi:hypothetical protein
VYRTLAFAACVFAVLGVLESRLRAMRHVALTRRLSDEATLPSPTAARLLSLGHREWAADLLWINALVYYGDTLATHQQQRFLQRYADTIEAVDPRFRQAYLWSATVSIYNARAIRRDSVDAAIRHLERGLREFPGDGEMLEHLGHAYLYELPRLLDDPVERAEAQRRGAEYQRRAAAAGAGPPWLALSAAAALEQAGLADRAIEHLRGIYLRTEDPQMRATIEARIEQITRERGTRDPAFEAERRIEDERRRSFPYVPLQLYLFVGPPVDGVRPGATPAAPARTTADEDTDAGAAPDATP